MYPVILRLGPITLYSFGLMLALAFLAANYFFVRGLREHHLDENIAGHITMICLVGGIVGSKLFSIFENWSDFSTDPIHQLFSPAGLTFYGGFLVAGAWVYSYVKRRKLNFTLFADMAAPTVLLAYGIGRIGCQLAGDGDYGIPSKLPWAMAYPQGTAKTSTTLLEYFAHVPSARQMLHYDSLVAIKTGIDQMGQKITRFDEITTVHPAPVYETIFCVIVFLLIWKYRAKLGDQIGKIFAVTLVAMGTERLLVEFIRINPLYWGLSMAQWISIALIVYGTYRLAVVFPKRRKQILAHHSTADFTAVRTNGERSAKSETILEA